MSQVGYIPQVGDIVFSAERPNEIPWKVTCTDHTAKYNANKVMFEIKAIGNSWCDLEPIYGPNSMTTLNGANVYVRTPNKNIILASPVDIVEWKRINLLNSEIRRIYGKRLIPLNNSSSS